MTDAALAQLILAEQAERDLASEYENLFWDDATDEESDYWEGVEPIPSKGISMSYHEFCFHNRMTDEEMAREERTYFEMVREDGELLFEFPNPESWRNTWVDPHFDGIPF